LRQVCAYLEANCPTEISLSGSWKNTVGSQLSKHKRIVKTKNSVRGSGRVWKLLSDVEYNNNVDNNDNDDGNNYDYNTYVYNTDVDNQNNPTNNSGLHPDIFSNINDNCNADNTHDYVNNNFVFDLQNTTVNITNEHGKSNNLIVANNEDLFEANNTEDEYTNLLNMDNYSDKINTGDAVTCNYTDEDNYNNPNSNQDYLDNSNDSVLHLDYFYDLSNDCDDEDNCIIRHSLLSDTDDDDHYFYDITDCNPESLVPPPSSYGASSNNATNVNNFDNIDAQHCTSNNYPINMNYFNSFDNPNQNLHNYGSPNNDNTYGTHPTFNSHNSSPYTTNSSDTTNHKTNQKQTRTQKKKKETTTPKPPKKKRKRNNTDKTWIGKIVNVLKQHGQGTTKQICEWISQTYPEFVAGKPKFKNTVASKLSNNSLFSKKFLHHLPQQRKVITWGLAPLCEEFDEDQAKEEIIKWLTS